MSIIAGRSQEYVEVNLDAGLDPDILLALDLNVAIDGLGYLSGLGDLQEEWGLDESWTPDTSISGAPAWLMGDAQFQQPTTVTSPPLAQDPIVYDGAIGECVRFTQTGYVWVAGISALDDPLPNATVSCWVKQPTSNTSIGARTIVEKAGSYKITIAGNGALAATVWHDGTSTSCGPYTPSTYPQGWRHVALVFDGPGAALTLWIDGAAQSEVALGGATPHEIEGTSANVTIGPAGTGSSGSLLMAVDQVRIDRVVRSENEILRLAYVAEATVTQASLPQWFLDSVEASGRSLTGYTLPTGSPLTRDTIDLGKLLFDDPGLSPDNIKCSDCHVPTQSLDFTDDDNPSLGASSTPSTRNAPTVLDRLWSSHQFWDGRAPSLEAQALGPLFNPDEMNSTSTYILDYLNNATTPNYTALFSTAYSASPSIDLVAKALASYQRSVVSDASPADEFEAGTVSALTTTERGGRNLFFGKARCFACHNGPNFTDEQFHVTVTADTDDGGRGDHTGRLRDAFRFKTPSLRQLSDTGPYFHDGSADTLEEVIEAYVNGGDHSTHKDEEILPLDLSDYEVGLLVAYLNAIGSNWTEH
jgi:cytochrome c peroxidase